MKKLISNDKYYSLIFICKQGRMKYGYINQPTFDANGIASALCNVPHLVYSASYYRVDNKAFSLGL